VKPRMMTVFSPNRQSRKQKNGWAFGTSSTSRRQLARHGSGSKRPLPRVNIPLENFQLSATETEFFPVFLFLHFCLSGSPMGKERGHIILLMKSPREAAMLTDPAPLGVSWSKWHAGLGKEHRPRFSGAKVNHTRQRLFPLPSFVPLFPLPAPVSFLLSLLPSLLPHIVIAASA
jgi:hypothetical protein